jgi:hypothetical protein
VNVRHARTRSSDAEREWFRIEDEMAQSVECWPLDREIRVQLPAEESHSS